MNQLENIVRAYYEAFNARNLSIYADSFAPDCVLEAPGFSGRGLEAMRQFDQGWLQAFPNARIESLRMTSAGNIVVTGNWLHGGKHQGTLKTSAGDIPPTGADFQAPYCSLFELSDGKIKLQRLLFEANFVPRLLGLG